jgi:hypothetical protein
MRTGKADLTLETLQENEQLSERRRALADQFGEMHRSLELLANRQGAKATRKWLGDMAKRLVREKNKQEVDRQAKRRRNALICWFAEHCPEIAREFPPPPRIPNPLPVPILPRAPVCAIARSAFGDDPGFGDDWVDPDFSEDADENEDGPI